MTLGRLGNRCTPPSFWSTRAGDYRAVYEIDAEQKHVRVLFVGHRKRVYGSFIKMLWLWEGQDSRPR